MSKLAQLALEAALDLLVSDSASSPNLVFARCQVPQKQKCLPLAFEALHVLKNRRLAVLRDE